MVLKTLTSPSRMIIMLIQVEPWVSSLDSNPSLVPCKLTMPAALIFINLIFTTVVEDINSYKLNSDAGQNRHKIASSIHAVFLTQLLLWGQKRQSSNTLIKQKISITKMY